MKLLDQLRTEIRLRHNSIRTEHSYCIVQLLAPYSYSLLPVATLSRHS